MRILILCSNDLFAGMLMAPLLRNGRVDVVAIMAQSDIMVKGKSSWNMFRQVMRTSGWEYALYEAIQIKGFAWVAALRALSRRKRESVADYALPSKLAKQSNIPYETFADVHASDTLQRIRALQPDLILSLRSSQIIKASLLTIPLYGILNFHGSMLPQYRGLGSVFQAIYRGEKELGYTMHRVDEAIDTGAVVAQRTMPVIAGKSVSFHYMQLHIRGGALVMDAVDQIANALHIHQTAVDSPASYYSWPEHADVRQFLKQGGRLITASDFWWMLFHL